MSMKKKQHQITYDSSDFDDDEYADECFEIAYFLRLGCSREDANLYAQGASFLEDLYHISWFEAAERAMSPD